MRMRPLNDVTRRARICARILAPDIPPEMSATCLDTAVSLLKGENDWSKLSFASYAEERAERMRRLRFAAKVQAVIDMEFGDAARARRADIFKRAAADPSLRIQGFAVMAGPEALPPEAFSQAAWDRIMGDAA